MNAKRLALPAAAIALIFLFAGGAGASEGGAPFVPNPAAEAEACEATVLAKPTEWAGLPQGDVGDVEWFARVAFHRAYGRWPNEANPVELDRLGTIITCVSLKLLPPPPPGPVDFPPAQQPPLPPIAPTPTPGGYYAIKPGDTLFEVSGTAYKTQGPTNAARAKLINEHPYNQRFRRLIDGLPGLSQQAKTFEKSIFGATRITFSPVFGTFAQQFADAGDGAQGEGANYAVIYIPEAP